MCTVTYIPHGNNSFTLTSNRDEQPVRSPKSITQIQMKDHILLFPRDTGAGGTWIAASSQNKVICLLNGAFDKHQRKTQYRRSRGLMVLDYFEFKESSHFFSDYQFQGMEPFTIVVFDKGQLFEARWDEEKLHVKKLSPEQQYIWSSSTLYDQETKTKRVNWFRSWQKQNPQPTMAQIMDFHTIAGDGDPWNDVIMNRNEIVKTVSVTSIEKTNNLIQFTYRDLIEQNISASKIQLSSELVETTQV